MSDSKPCFSKPGSPLSRPAGGAHLARNLRKPVCGFAAFHSCVTQRLALGCPPIRGRPRTSVMPPGSAAPEASGLCGLADLELDEFHSGAAADLDGVAAV